MDKVKRFQILLSTYNGEHYIQEQLDSFTRLDNFDEVKVLIRDDGSCDRTCEILKSYSERFGFEIIYGENVGLNKSLYVLLQNADLHCEYFAFSDQDDVWLPDKLTRAAEFLSKIDKEIPALYAACSYLTDAELNITGHTLIPKRLSFYNAMVQNVCIGHTQAFNRKQLLQIADKFSDDIMIVDYWNYLFASACGTVIYDKKPTTLYRQHEKNVIGYSNSFFGTLKTRFRRVRTKKSYENAKQLASFVALSKDIIPEAYEKEAIKFFARQKNFLTRLGYCFSTKAFRQTFAETLIFKTMYLFGRYNLKQKNLQKRGDKK